MDPSALKILALLPAPTNSNLLNHYVIPGYTNFRHTTIPSFKIDHNVNDRNRLSFYFSDTMQRSPSANGFTQVITPAAPQGTNAYTYRLNYDRTVSPTKILHLGAGYLYQYVPSVPPEYDPNSLGFRTNFFASIFPIWRHQRRHTGRSCACIGRVLHTSSVKSSSLPATRPSHGSAATTVINSVVTSLSTASDAELHARQWRVRF